MEDSPQGTFASRFLTKERLGVAVLCLAASVMLYWNYPRKHRSAGPDSFPPAPPLPPSFGPGQYPTAKMEAEARVTLSDDYLNLLVKEGADEKKFAQIYGPPTLSKTRDGVTITFYDVYLNKFHVIPLHAGRVGFHVVIKGGKVVDWKPVSVGG